MPKANQGKGGPPVPKANQGKGGPPVSMAAAKAGKGEWRARVQQQTREKREREKREAFEAIAAAKEYEAKQRDLEERLPMLLSHDITVVPWENALNILHIHGGSQGVDIVELVGASAVCLRYGPSIFTESIVDVLATLLDVRVAHMRLVQTDTSECVAIGDIVRKLRGWCRFPDTSAVLEFVPGMLLEVAAESMENASPDLLMDLGQLCALDLLLNNWDRVPLPCWGNGGNLANAIVTPSGRLVGIDQQVNFYCPGPVLDHYLHQVRDLSAQVFRGNAPTVVDCIRVAIRTSCGVELSDLSMEFVIKGMGIVLRRAALEFREGRLGNILAIVVSNFSSLPKNVHPVDPAEVAAKNVEFLQKVACAVADSLPDQ